MIDLGGVGALISALTGLLVAAGSVLLQRQRRSAVDADEMEDELEVRTKQFQAALRHMRTMEDTLADHGIASPRRPAELRPGYFQQQQGRGRRRRNAAGEGGGAGDDPAADEPEPAVK